MHSGARGQGQSGPQREEREATTLALGCALRPRSSREDRTARTPTRDSTAALSTRGSAPTTDQAA